MSVDIAIGLKTLSQLLVVAIGVSAMFSAKAVIRARGSGGHRLTTLGWLQCLGLLVGCALFGYSEHQAAEDKAKQQRDSAQARIELERSQATLEDVRKKSKEAEEGLRSSLERLNRLLVKSDELAVEAAAQRRVAERQLQTAQQQASLARDQLEKQNEIHTLQTRIAEAQDVLMKDQAVFGNIQNESLTRQNQIAKTQDVQIASLSSELAGRKQEIERLERGSRRLVALELAIPIERSAANRLLRFFDNACFRASLSPQDLQSRLEVETRIETSGVGFLAICRAKPLGQPELAFSQQAAPNVVTEGPGFASIFGKPTSRDQTGRRIIEALFGEDFQIKTENGETLLKVGPSTTDLLVTISSGVAKVFFAGENVTVGSLRDYPLYLCRFMTDRELKADSNAAPFRARIFSRDPYFSFARQFDRPWRDPTFEERQKIKLRPQSLNSRSVLVAGPFELTPLRAESRLP